MLFILIVFKPITVFKFLERESLRYCTDGGKVTFTRPFLMLGKVTFDEHVNVLDRNCNSDISYKFTKP